MANISWLGGSGDFNVDGNWGGGVAPDASDVAVFDTSSGTVSFSADTSFLAWQNEAGDYTLTNPGYTISFIGDGIDVIGGSATLQNDSGGAIHFNGSSSAGSATILNDGNVRFYSNASAGSADITIGATGRIDFYAGTTADQAEITNNGDLRFQSGSTAENATIANNNSLQFIGASAGNATITTTNGADVIFDSAADGGTAAFITEAGGTVQFSATPNAGFWTAGSIAGAGTYLIGGNELRVGGNDTSTEMSGAIQGVGGSLVKTGTGTLALSGSNNFTGATTVSEGTLQVDGSIAASSGVTVQDGATLGGSGTTSSVTLQAGGILNPGDAGETLPCGVLSVGNLLFSSGSSYAVDLSGTAVGTHYDQVDVTGAVVLSNATLSISVNVNVAAGSEFIIIANDGTDAVAGTFNGLAEGQEFTSNSRVFEISYSGGDGNDVVLSIGGAVITGTPNADIYNGSSTPGATNGRDIISGLGGDDLLFGLAGDDTLNGGEGVDTVNGDAGNDIFEIQGAQALHDVMDGGADTDTIEVIGSGAVMLDGFKAAASSIEQWDGNGKGVKGTGAKDVFDFSGLTSQSGLDFINGRGGNDRIVGSDFRDDLRGSVGIDTLIGGGQRDVLSGGKHGDKLTGGASRDLFDFDRINESRFGKHRDKITDFGHGNDDIDLRGIDAKSGGGNQKFKWIGKADFHGKKGELHFEKQGKHVVVEGDINGDGRADFQILVLNHGAMHKGDFLL
ncbi:autotransporter-associated beta strand repeat-containing protein [Methyloligella sp. 2.7D]|uniref:beta strand repeat-containing protein n=1 Tax=unclassified Methyloligella TaxID=2625955 RepID=UPI00157C596A|nr:calcium-binding protein [Methyloligella sp. GL2]QKP76535.1 autotransporter-associated beta strand repeat-containing protein [Methyloligella sp. GL2]